MRRVPALVFSRFSSHLPKRWWLRGSMALPRAWHLLSLDAPTVAATWCAAFLSVSGVGVRHPSRAWPVLFLSLATWLCYVGDRTLDARAAPSGAPLHARHHFYGALWTKQRPWLLAAGCIAGLACAAIALCALTGSLLCAYLLLTSAALVYFAFVHWGSGRGSRVLAKEATVAVIFALGCVLPAWQSTHASALVPVGVLFGAACWLNCVAIERWEGRGGVPVRAHWSTHWAARHLATLLNAAAVSAAALGLLARRSGGSASLAWCLALAFLCLALLERFRGRLSVEALRILADVALLTPAAGWVLARLLC